MSESLTEFLLTQIAEDEARVDGFHQGSDPDFFWGPDRIRAECEAKRRIVEAHRAQVEDDDSHAWIVASRVLLRALALPYADHPDYREEWRP